MKKFLFRTIFAAMCAPVLLSAGENSERKLADAAFAAGDYANAISGYRNAMTQADVSNDQDAWTRSALQLCAAYLRSGELNSARAVYADFRRRDPLRSAGTLPGDLLAAEGKFAEAEKFLRKLAAGSPEMADAATFSMGMVKMRAGDIAGAHKLFAALAKSSSPWAHAGRNEMIYTFIRMGKYADALAELGAQPEASRDENWEQLRFLAEAGSGKIDGFKAEFDRFMAKQTPRPHIRVLELLSSAAHAAVAKNDTRFATKCLNSALEFSPDISVKRDLIRRLINIYAVSAPEQAVAEAKLYAERFPSAPDRGAVLTSVGRLMMSHKHYDRALEIFTAAARDLTLPPADRLTAAAEIVAGAGKFSRSSEAEFYQMLCAGAATPAERALWHCRYAEYLEKKSDNAGAVREYRMALRVAPEKSKEQIYFQMLGFFVRSGDEKNIVALAEKLDNSAVPLYQAAAKFERGILAEKNGDLAAARGFYRDAGTVPGKYRDQALFMAAFTAYRLNDLEAAGNEFAVFAEAHPDSPLAPNAIYYALEIASTRQADAKIRQLEELFSSKYASSQAWAYHVLNVVRARGERGDIPGAIAELESKLGNKFSGTDAGVEKELLLAKLYERSGESAKAMPLYLAVAADRKNLPAAAESAWRAGEIRFKAGEYPAAKELFLLAAKLSTDDNGRDIATGRAVDCDLIRSESLSPEELRACSARCETLAANSANWQLKLQALYKLGVCRELAGESAKAISSYEKLLYAAGIAAAEGLEPDPQWCVRAVESALKLLVRHRGAGALQRGVRMIKQLRSLQLADGTDHAQMQDEFLEQLKKTRRK